TPHYLGIGDTSAVRALHAVYRPLGSLVFARARRIICVTRTEAEEVATRFPAARGRITVIPNGIDVSAIRAAAPAPADETVVLSAGRLAPYKNVDLAIRALE